MSPHFEPAKLRPSVINRICDWVTPAIGFLWWIDWELDSLLPSAPQSMASACHSQILITLTIHLPPKSTNSRPDKFAQFQCHANLCEWLMFLSIWCVNQLKVFNEFSEIIQKVKVGQKFVGSSIILSKYDLITWVLINIYFIHVGEAVRRECL